MPHILSVRPDLRKQRQRVDLDGITYRIDLTWRDRARGWYLDLYTQDGAPIALGRRVTADWSPLHGTTDPRIPPGLLQAVGPDDYTREDLGDRLQLIYFTEEELSKIAP